MQCLLKINQYLWYLFEIAELEESDSDADKWAQSVETDDDMETEGNKLCVLWLAFV